MRRHCSVSLLVLLAVSWPGVGILNAAEDPFAVLPSGLTLTAKTNVDKAAPGDKIDVQVTLKNDMQERRSFDVPSMWWAKSDNAAITFPSWPKMGGLGPAITYQKIELEPGQSWSRAWPATVADNTKEGEFEFKIGLALKRMDQDQQWSSPMKVSILAKKPQPATQAAPVNPATRPAAGNATTRPAVHVVNVRDLIQD
jgi:hypothetical protein